MPFFISYIEGMNSRMGIPNKLDVLLKEDIPEMAKLADKTIHLNVLAASALVTDAIIEYKREHKDINFQLLQNNQENLYDIEITTKASDSSNNEEKLQGKNEFICHEKIYLAVPNNEKYKGRTSIDLREMMDEGFISLAGSKQFSAICEKFCHTLGVKPKIIFESDNPSAVKNMIMANMGVGFWPQFTWGSVDEKHVRLLEIEGVLCQRDIVISYNLNKQDNSNVIAFYDFLKTRFFTK